MIRRKKTGPPVRVAYNEVYEVIPAGPPNGTILAMNLQCGACKFWFKRRYSMAQLDEGFPHEVCPNCEQENYVPFRSSGRGDAR